jgi:iron-sulfur cluster assembly protein
MITLTPLAAEKVLNNLTRRGRGHGIKIGVKTTGCSGLAYVLEYVDEPVKEDITVISEGVHIFIDPKAIPYVSGMSMDWVKNGLNEGFDFINPNEKDRCGCGESFRV